MQRANPLNTPMTASYNDPVVAVDELGREIRMTGTGQRYLGTDLAPARPQATAGRGLGYNILDNIIGYDDGVDTPGERAGAAIGAIASDPIGAARGAAMGIGGLIERLVGGTGAMGDVVDAVGLLNLGTVAGAAPRGALRVGAARSVEETPAQAIAGLLREGRADEVTDEMMAAADPQEMARLYASGATGMDLPMDEASRMARAREMGFTTGRNRRDPIAEIRKEENPQLVHYTNQDFQEFRVPERGNRQAIWATPDPSLNLATKDNFRSFDEEGVVGLPIMARMTNRMSPFDFRMQGEPLTPGFPSAVTAEDLAKARRVGADYAEGGMEYAIFDPRNIRSRFARFDPRLSHLSNLNAANTSPLLGGAVLAAPQEQPDPLRNLRGLLAR